MARISKIYRILISALLALLGFSCVSCSGAYEYGTPTATYKAKGVVVSEADNSPIKGIRTEFKNSYNPANAAYTDSAGSFSLKSGDLYGPKLYVKLIDVDGEENGSFTETEVEADYTNIPLTGGDGRWYKGAAEIDLGIIKMKPE
jgi:putative lipoprotein (rSAM/lipoprotein system)